MADFRKSILGIAGALLCAGIAQAAPANCGAPTATTTIVRAEGTTEQLAQVTWTCTIQPGGTAIPSSAGFAAQVFISPALPITSRAVNTTGGTEASVTVTCTTCVVAPVGAVTVLGSISGSTLNLNGGLPALTGGVTYTGGDVLTFVLSNVRVNATSLSIGSGVPPSISETIFVSGAALNPAALASVTVGFAQNGLGATSVRNGTGTGYPAAILTSAGISTSSTNAVANNFVICNANTMATAFVVQVRENFAAAFKDGGSAPAITVNGGIVAATAAGGSAIGPASERSQVEGLGSGNSVASGTRFSINFSNVPNNVTLYVPMGQLVSTSGAPAGTISVAQLNSAAAGAAFSQSGYTAATSTAITGLGYAGTAAVAPVAISGGTGSANFEVVRADTTSLDAFYVPVFVVNSANAVPGSSTAISFNVSLNPVGSTSIPNFAVGGSTTTLNGSAFNLCTTTLLFPFVTNQLGFDTGLAISNTSTDPFGARGAVAQAGTCTMNFYGNGAPTPNNVTTANVPSGTTYSAALSSVAAGFQGYVIAQCQFQYAHGFAFVTNGVGPTGGLSQGYLASIIPDVNQKVRAADPLSVAGAGSGETLGQ